jgi:hypothetical protein
MFEKPAEDPPVDLPNLMVCVEMDGCFQVIAFM